MVTKFYYILHLPRQFKQSGILFPCFVHERKHRELKRFAGEIRNTGCNFESSLLEEITCKHIAHLQDTTFSLGPRLVNPVARPSPNIVGALRVAIGEDLPIALANRARFNEWGEATKHDVVMMRLDGRHRAGRVLLAADIDGTICFVVVVWRFVRRHRCGSVWDDTNPTHALVEADAIVDTLMWSEIDVARILVLSPKV